MFDGSSLIRKPSNYYQMHFLPPLSHRQESEGIACRTAEDDRALNTASLSVVPNSRLE